MIAALVPSRVRRGVLLPGCIALAVLAATLPAQARTLDEVKARGRLSMCAHPDALPFASEKGDPPGFQVEIGRAIAERLGVSLEVLWIKPRYRANLVNCDMLLDNVSNPAASEGRVLLSHPYHRTGIALGLNAQSPQVAGFYDFSAGQKVGVMVGSVAQTLLGRRGITTSPYAFEEDMLADLAKGDLVGAAVSPGRLAWYIHNNPGAGLRMVHAYESEPQLAWSVSLGLRKSDQAMLDQVNQALDGLLADGTIAGIYRKYGLEHRAP
jgi:polar amino acid transport system substrate-binding protein